MKWLLEDIYRAFLYLKRWQTWLFIGLFSLFAGLAYLVSRFAFRTDSLLIYLHRTAGACREMSNGAIMFMFFGMIFFALMALLTIGEFQQFFEFRERGAHHQAKMSLRWAIGWCLFAIAIAISALVFFSRYCR